MRTPTEYTKNLAAGVVTTEMLSDALYSVNKRAKNYRDKGRECNHRYHGKYADNNYYRSDQFYAKKEQLLSYLQPICIHREFAGFERTRVYDYNRDFRERYFEHLLDDSIVWQNSYLDYNDWKEVYFFDYVEDKPTFRYYLYTICGNSTYHTPIEEKDVKKYDLPVVEIGYLDTHGHEPNELLSMQFVNKIIDALESGTAHYKKTIEDNPSIYEYKPTVFAEKYKYTKNNLQYALSEYGGNFRNQVIKAIIEQIPDDAFISEEEIIPLLNLSQKWHKKKEKHKQPTIKCSKKKVQCFFHRDDMIDFIFERTKDLPATERANAIVALLTSEESPVYTELCAAINFNTVADIVLDRFNDKALKMWQQDKKRRITLRKGELAYQEYAPQTPQQTQQKPQKPKPRKTVKVATTPATSSEAL